MSRPGAIVRRIREVAAYTREALGVVGEMMGGLISSSEAEREIDQLRRRYGLRDRP